jgi:hypothetical protein
MHSRACVAAGLIPHGLAGVGAVNVFVAACAPAGALLQAAAVFLAADNDGAVTLHGRMLEVTSQAEVGVTSDEHLLIHRPVRVVADRAAFEHGIVLEEEGALLRGMALRARLVLVLEVCPCVYDDMASMRIMAVTARYVTVEDLMRMREMELAAFVEMALEAGLGRPVWIDDRASGAAGVDVGRAGTVARLATGVPDRGVSQSQASVGSRGEMIGDICVAFHTRLRALESGTRDMRRNEDGSIDRHAGDQQHAPRCDAAEEQGAFRETLDECHGSGSCRYGEYGAPDTRPCL